VIVLDTDDQLDDLIYDPDIAIGLWFTSLSGCQLCSAKQMLFYIATISVCLPEKVLIRNSRNLHFLSPDQQS